MKRSVRQRDGFGCVRCGSPIYIYEHFVPFAEVQEHTIENIYLACSSLHEDKSGLISLEEIDRWRKAPINRQKETSSARALSFPSGPYSIQLGGSRLDITDRCPAIAIEVNHHPILAFDVDLDGRLVLSVDIRDAAGKPLLVIQNNEAVVGTEQWDVEWTRTSTVEPNGSLLTLRSGPGELALMLRFLPDLPGVKVERANLVHDERRIHVDEDLLEVDGVSVAGQLSENVDVLLEIGHSKSGRSRSINVP